MRLKVGIWSETLLKKETDAQMCTTFIKRLTLSIFFEKKKRLYLRRGKLKIKTIILLREPKGNNIARKQGWYEKENIHIKVQDQMASQVNSIKHLEKS